MATKLPTRFDKMNVTIALYYSNKGLSDIVNIRQGNDTFPSSTT